jgi:hypothetical protein
VGQAMSALLLFFSFLPSRSSAYARLRLTRLRGSLNSYYLSGSRGILITLSTVYFYEERLHKSLIDTETADAKQINTDKRR